ncbi:MAG: hypothetical protein IKD16_01575 [Bacteroidales bacterium]|nr:hypothetical protein [Bacteroidales bacterium]
MKKELSLIPLIILIIFFLSSCEKEYKSNLPMDAQSGISIDYGGEYYIPILVNDTTIHFQISKNVDLANVNILANFSKDTNVFLNGNLIEGLVTSDISDFVNPLFKIILNQYNEKATSINYYAFI